MSNAFTLFQLYIYTAPVIGLILFTYLFKWLFKRKKTKIKAADLTVPVLLIAIYYLFDETIHASVMPYYIIFLLVLGILLLVLQATKKGEILYGKFLKIYWRLLFLVNFLVYLFLVVLSIAHHFI